MRRIIFFPQKFGNSRPGKSENTIKNYNRLVPSATKMGFLERQNCQQKEKIPKCHGAYLNTYIFMYVRLIQLKVYLITSTFLLQL